MLQDTVLQLICLSKKPLLSLTKSRKLLEAKEILKSTRDGSAGSDPKGYLIFQETSLLGNESSPLLVYFVNILIGISLFVVFIREVVSYGKLVLSSKKKKKKLRK